MKEHAIYRGCLALCLCLCVLISCTACPSETAATTYHMTLSERVYTCTETGVRYRVLPEAYIPCTLQNATYAIYAVNDTATIQFHELTAGTAGKYLCRATEDEGSLYPIYMLAAEDYTMPSLAEMHATRMVVCGDTISFWLSRYDELTDAERLATLVEAISQPLAKLPEGESPELRAHLLFFSEEYPDFAYDCLYLRYSGDRHYLYLESSETAARVSGTLLEDLRMEGY